MRVLATVRALDLPDSLVFSGAVYQRVLNHLTGRPADYGVRDYDLGYFDASDISYEAEDAVIRRVAAAFDEQLRSVVEVRNQARVHVWFEDHFGEAYTPLSCTAEALERFVSPMFAVGVRLDADDRLHVAAPFGLADLFALRLRPEPASAVRRLRAGRRRRHRPLARTVASKCRPSGRTRPWPRGTTGNWPAPPRSGR